MVDPEKLRRILEGAGVPYSTSKERSSEDREEVMVFDGQRINNPLPAAFVRELAKPTN